MTKGEYRVGVTLNPSNDSLVDQIKRQAADLIDLIDSIEELEANLAKALELALKDCPFQWGTGSYNDWWYERRAKVAELTGGKDGD